MGLYGGHNVVFVDGYLCTRAQDRIVWLEPVENTDRRTALWERIMAGDRASKVLAP